MCGIGGRNTIGRKCRNRRTCDCWGACRAGSRGATETASSFLFVARTSKCLGSPPPRRGECRCKCVLSSMPILVKPRSRSREQIQRPAWQLVFLCGTRNHTNFSVCRIFDCESIINN